MTVNKIVKIRGGRTWAHRASFLPHGAHVKGVIDRAPLPPDVYRTKTKLRQYKFFHYDSDMTQYKNNYLKVSIFDIVTKIFLTVFGEIGLIFGLFGNVN
jgi:hypothetical protein